jgi:tripartite-type tricarboxylate transporter receptor subunit TctC
MIAMKRLDQGGSMFKILSACALAFVVGTASGQGYPNKPVRIITAGAGGGADVALRLLSTPLGAGLGQSVVIDNRGGNVVSTVGPVITAAPDGYTLLFYGSGLLLFPMMSPGAFDFFKDFTPITLVDSSPSVLVVHPSIPVNTVKEVIAYAKNHPGVLNYAGGTAGTAPTLAGQLFTAMTNLNITRINYKGTGQALADLVAGRVQMMFVSAAGSPFIRSGKLKAIAVTTAKPSALYPNLPTVASGGLPGFEVDSYHALFGPAGLPAPIVNRIHVETVRALRTEDLKAKLFAAGFDIVGNTPQELAAQLKVEASLWSKIVKESDLKDE